MRCRVACLEPVVYDSSRLNALELHACLYSFNPVQLLAKPRSILNNKVTSYGGFVLDA